MNLSGGEGAEVVYALRNNSELAQKVLDSIGEEGQIKRKIYQKRYPTDPSKDYYFIHRLTGKTQPLLIEYGFIDNNKDLLKLQENILNYGEAVVRAVSDYIGIQYDVPSEIDTNIYIVKKGDNLYDIAKRFNVTVSELKIANNFDGIYGTPVRHNESSLISGIGEVMTDDKKILAIKDILKSNNRHENDCCNVYYIGYGYSDATAMRFVHNNGGKAVFVHQPDQNDGLYNHNNKIYQVLNTDGMIDFCCVADYRKGSSLSNVLQRRSRKIINIINII